MSGAWAVGSGRLVAGLAVVAVWLSVGGVGSAWATTGHAFAGQFGELGNGAGQFGEPLQNGPAGLAVMPSTGEVFTADAGQGSSATAPHVQRFSAAGVVQSGFAIGSPYNAVGSVAVDAAGSGAVYVATNREPSPFPAVVKFSMDGEVVYELDASTSGTTINNPVFGAAPLAVDPANGTVHVAATGGSGLVIDRFSGTTGDFIDSFDGSSSPEAAFVCPPTSLAVDGLQRVYVLDPCKGPTGTGRVDRFSAAGVYEATVDIPPRSDGSLETPSAVAVDPLSGEVYVAHSGPVGMQVTHFTAGGAAPVYTFDASQAAGVKGMAVSDTGMVYTSDGTDPVVERFAPFDGPTVVTGAAPSSVDARSAVLEGTVNPEGVSTSYHFEYGFDQTYGKRSPALVDEDAGSGSSPVSAAAAISGLQPAKTYHYRLVGSNASGSIVGADQSFMTLPAPADTGSAFASAITPRSARLHGTINPNNSFFASYYMEYGTTASYGSTAVGSDNGSLCFACGGVDRPAIAPVLGLEPGTTYHFRVVADNGTGGPQFGADQTFVTAPAAGGGGKGMTAGRATLTGTINPHGVATSYHFNYGLTASYGASTSEVDGGSGDGDQPVTQPVSGLLPDTTYHVQVVATSANGVVRSGGDGLFRTAPAPTAEVIGQTGVSADAATLVGEVNTAGQTGSYHFDVWSLDSSYAITTAERPVAGLASAERVSAALTGLPSGETFGVQLTVTSNDSLGVSDLDTFATPVPPRVFPPAPGVTDVYGCAAPKLNAYNAKPKPGEVITITGRDLGVGGSVVLADRTLKPADWSATGFKVTVPEDAAGALALTVNCGHRSNTIAVAVFQEPDSGFSIVRRSVAGSRATVSVKVSGPGKLEIAATSGLRGAKTTIKRPGTATIKVKLTDKAARALKRSKSGRRTVSARVRFTPAGGRSASKTIAITFKRGGGR